MKKYFAAAIVAVMVFAFSAFAAELDVDAGVMAFGVDNVEDCGGDAELVFSHHNEDGFGYVDAVLVQFPNATTDNCAGATAYLTIDGMGVAPEDIVVDSNGGTATYIVTAGTSVAGSNQITGTQPRFGHPIGDIGEVTLTIYSQNTPGNAGQTPPGFRTGAFA